jgi:maleylpyruvate isomerase
VTGAAMPFAATVGIAPPSHGGLPAAGWNDATASTITKDSGGAAGAAAGPPARPGAAARPPARHAYRGYVPPELREICEQIDDATQRLLVTVGGFGDADTQQPSLLPGWSRGHVLTHLARGAEALSNLLTGARTGVPIPAYTSQEARNAAVEAGAKRGAEELRADVASGAATFGAAVSAMPDHAWQVTVDVLNYASFPASQILTRRLVELELHHTDLGAGYTPADWPHSFAALDLPEPMLSQRQDRIAGQTWA